MKERARDLRQIQTDAERLLWRHLRTRQMAGCKFRRQEAIGHYIVDFVCFDQKLVIEIDGGQHAVNVEYDSSRTAELQQRGYRVLRYWNHEVLGNLAAVLNDIRNNIC